jgi:hypothetical protein
MTDKKLMSLMLMMTDKTLKLMMTLDILDDHDSLGLQLKAS